MQHRCSNFRCAGVFRLSKGDEEMSTQYLRLMDTCKDHLAESARKAKEKREAEQVEEREAAEQQAAGGASDTAYQYKAPRLRVDHIQETKVMLSH